MHLSIQDETALAFSVQRRAGDGGSKGQAELSGVGRRDSAEQPHACRRPTPAPSCETARSKKRPATLRLDAALTGRWIMMSSCGRGELVARL